MICVAAILHKLEVVHSPVMASRIKQAKLPHETHDGQILAPGWVTRLALRSMISANYDDYDSPSRVVGRALRRGLEPSVCEAAERLGGWEALVALAQGFRP